MKNATVTIDIGVKFDNSYAQKLEGFYVSHQGDKAPAPILLKLNHSLAEALGFELNHLQTEQVASIFSGSVSPMGATPLAQVYAGHQFGSFSPQLGDGRALLLGEIINRKGERYDIHLKGSGPTPFSRGGDGKAVLGPVLREYIMGEAMHALNVPTTRALAVVMTGEKIMRKELLPGAVLTRIAASHLRVGTFQFFANRNETDKVKQLADYTIERHFHELVEDQNPYLGLLRTVCDRQAVLIAKWMLVGFVHGVMNTDNMTLSGETIDYGPCAFLDQYDPATVFSSIDKNGRYSYSNQPNIAQWNLARFAETLLPLIADDHDKAVKLASHEVNDFSRNYQKYWLTGMRAKLGLMTVEEGDFKLAQDLHLAMEGQNVDFTLLFRGLADAVQGETGAIRELFDTPEKFDQWYKRWAERLARESVEPEQRIASMNTVNPLYIPRNHKVEEALYAAEKESNYAPFEKLMAVLTNPFEKKESLSEYAEPAPESFASYQTFCGT